MSAQIKTLARGEILFREGDPSDCCYVIKSGRISIVKAKGAGEIELASIGPGQMFGEMAFFDNKPRSAGAKASSDSTVIILPFASLNSQFQAFPQWLKVMVKTVNDNLREANKRIKNLEQLSKGDEKMFSPYTINKLCAIIGLVASRYGEKAPEGVAISGSLLRNYTIQVFQEPTNKMNRLLEILQGLDLVKVEDLGEGRQKVTVLKLDMIVEFVDYYNKWLFTESSKRVEISANEVKLLKALQRFAKDIPPNDKGMTKISLTQIQNDSVRELGELIRVEQWDKLSEKKVISDKMSEVGGLFVTFDMNEINRITPFWNIVYTIEANDHKSL